MWIGVFYTNNNGNLACGGYSNWTSSENFAITAWGDDPTTVENEDIIDCHIKSRGLVTVAEPGNLAC